MSYINNIPTVDTQITLSGGNFGGEVVTWPANTQTLVQTDDSGNWNYDITLSVNPQEATFVGMM